MQSSISMFKLVNRSQDAKEARSGKEKVNQCAAQA